MSLKRREFLQYIGAGAASIYFKNPALGEPNIGPKDRPSFLTEFIPPKYCIPLPGDGLTAEEDEKAFSTFTVKDELTLPVGYRAQKLVAWGQEFGAPGHKINIGYNCDHLSLIKRANTPNEFYPDEYFLVINHEYVSSRPWTDSSQAVLGYKIPAIGLSGTEESQRLREGDMLVPLTPLTNLERYPELSQKIRELAEKNLRELGISIVHLKISSGGLEVVKDSKLHRRISTVERQNIESTTKFSFVGPGSSKLPTPLGTMQNCSGATTPWNTALTCEENIQDVSPEWVTANGKPFDNGKFKIGGYTDGAENQLPSAWTGLGTCLSNPLDNRTYGWVAEVIPETGELKKYISLGRFRHENVTIKCKKGHKLTLYMGDDRRGGHVWRFQSRDVVKEVSDRSNSKLMEIGTLACGKFNADFSGRWIDINLQTPVVYPNPLRVVDQLIFLPARPGGGPVIVTDRNKEEVLKLTASVVEVVTPKEWVEKIEQFCNKKFDKIVLGDLVQGDTNEEKELVILMDAFLMANAAGGTQCARPEDLEVHPFDDSVYIAFTDNTGKEQGSPDIEIFPDSRRVNSRQYGAIYRIEETSDDNKFIWGKFLSSGEVAESGAGFANVDNLAFDRDGNLWFACDISTNIYNHTVNHGPKESPGEKYFPGIFGNSSLFVVPTSGKFKGVPRLFATGPMESELTGIKFYEDENLEEFLLLSVQHPGEQYGVGAGKTEERILEIRTRAGKSFKQKRMVPLGSNFPGGKGSPPIPTVFAIKREEISRLKANS